MQHHLEIVKPGLAHGGHWAFYSFREDVWDAMTEAITVAALFAAGLLVGASRTPRDVMLKDASPPGQIGKVFGFVSAGLPLGGALAPVPFGYLMDHGRPDLVLVLVALVLLASLLCVGSARASAEGRALPAAAE